MRNISESKFEEKYYQYKDSIYRVAYNYLHHQQDSDDVVQDVFMKYLNSNEEFKSDDNEKYWLIRVTINTSLNYLKQSWKSKTNLDNEYIDKLQAPVSSDNEIASIVSKLKDKYKDVIILYYYLNYKVDEISSILKISSSNVKKRLERAREYIRKEIKNG